MENELTELLAGLDLSARLIMQILLTLFVAILFIQSGLDKVVNWKGEKAFYASHFKDTFLKNTIILLMPVITVSELSAGFLSGIGLLVLIFTGQTAIAFLGMLMASLSIVQLFFGQRIAKDYAGAATLVPYFLLTVAGLYFYLF